MIKTRLIEEKIDELFSIKFKFSDNLIKREDNLLKDKYDHNVFEYLNDFSKEEFISAIKYQKERNDNFIKFEGYERLNNSFGLEENISLIMVLKNNDVKWNINKELKFKKPELNELIDIEVRNFGKLYGEDFSRRNAIRLYDKLDYLGAYLNDKLVAVIYSYTYKNYTCIDGLSVDESYRKQYIATSLIYEEVRSHINNIIMLHADLDDTPKDIYSALGFEVKDKLYEYISTDISKIKL